MTSAISGTGGSLSAAYVKQMQEQMFKKADKNSDGSITKDELSQMQSSQNSQNGPSVDDIFAQMDSDSDGAISRLESDAGIAKLAQQMQSQGPPSPPPADSSSSSSDSTSATQIFDAMDTNKDGTVSASELFAALANKDGSSSDSSSSDNSSSSSSASGDNSTVKKIFDAMDTNEDGSVSKAELEAALAKAGQQMQAQGAPPPSTAQGTADSSATDATSSKDSAFFASAIKSYMQASLSSFSQSSNEATFSSSAVYG